MARKHSADAALQQSIQDHYAGPARGQAIARMNGGFAPPLAAGSTLGGSLANGSLGGGYGAYFDGLINEGAAWGSDLLRITNEFLIQDSRATTNRSMAATGVDHSVRENVNSYFLAMYAGDEAAVLKAYNALESHIPEQARPTVGTAVGVFLGLTKVTSDTVKDTFGLQQMGVEFGVGAIDYALFSITGYGEFQNGSNAFAAKYNSLMGFLGDIDQVPGNIYHDYSSILEQGATYRSNGDFVGAGKSYTEGVVKLAMAGITLGLLAKNAIKTIGDRKIINSHFAGQTIKTKGGDVRFDGDGFPDFTPYSLKTVRVEGLTGDMAHDVPLAMKRAGIKTYDKKNYVWHHHQDAKTMMLVPRNVHSVRNGGVAHTGGRAVIQHNLNNPHNLISYPSPAEFFGDL